MAAQRNTQSSYRRAILIYLLAIVAPTLALLYFGLQSVHRQREAITSLMVSNLRLSAERLAADLERRSWQLAEACLRDRELDRLGSALGDADTLEAARQLRASLASVAQRHPMARHFFVLHGNAVRFPLLHPPLPRQLEAQLVRDPGAVRHRFAALFAEAETQELQHQRLDLALAAYRRCYELPVWDSLKALALSRIARCHRKRHQFQAAEQAYRTLADQYGDLYDPFHRPYGLIAGLEQVDLVRTQAHEPDPRLAGMYRDLTDGRWELSAEQLDYFLTTLAQRLGDRLPSTRETEYLNHFKLARALQEGFRHHGPLQGGQVYAHTLTHGGTPYQTYYSRLGAEHEREILVGFAADLTWVEDQLLPQTRRELGMDDRFEVALQPARETTAQPDASEGRARFNTLFRFWELSIAPGSHEAWHAAARRQMAFVVASTASILGVLGLGVFLLIRDVSREMQMGRLRADFVCGVSHELRTPLTLIRLYGETLSYGENLSEEERRSYCDVITRESERLSHLVENILDFSRVDRGQKQYRLREGDVSEAIVRTVDLYGQYLTRRGFSIRRNLATHLPPIPFDGDAVSQSVLNLLDNAAKYSAESRFIGVELRAEDHQVVFEVEDHGIGISAGEREKIFEQFYRTPGATAKGGHGLGLFLVRHVMDAHGGRIELESEPGRGSRFRLIFPHA